MKMNKLFKTLFFSIIMVVLLTPVIGIELAGALSGISLVAGYLPMPRNVLGMNNTNNISARISYDRAKEIYFNAWIDSFGGDAAKCSAYIDTLKMSQHEIRLEVGLTTNNTNFKFALTPSDVNTTNLQFLTENRLTLQDTFVANEYSIFLAQTAGQNDTNFKLCTYPNTQIFAAADIAPLQNTFYNNGSFRMTCNNDVIVPYRGLFNHFYQGQTQQTAALGAGSPGDQIRGAEDGMITIEPNLLLIGSKGYVPEIILKSALTSVAANVRAVLIYRGVLAQNSTSVS